jgi:hypothetical protein
MVIMDEVLVDRRLSQMSTDSDGESVNSARGSAKVVELDQYIFFHFLRLKFFRQIETLMRCECLSEVEVKQLCTKAKEILIQEGNVQCIDSPVTVSFYSKKRGAIVDQNDVLRGNFIRKIVCAHSRSMKIFV